MEGQIIIDLTAQHAVIVQLAASRRGLRVIDAALASAAPFPDDWTAPILSQHATETATLLSLHQRRANAIQNAKLLAPALNGSRIICMLPDQDYEYRVETPGQKSIDAAVQGTPEATAQLNLSYWLRPPFPADSTSFRRLSTGVRIGVHRDSVKEIRRTLSLHQWDLESIISPATVASRSDRGSDNQLGVSLIDGVESVRFVLHCNGLPVFVRKLRLPWSKPNQAPASLSAAEWEYPSYAKRLSRDRINALILECQRTVQYVSRRCPIPIEQVTVHGPLGLDQHALSCLETGIAISTRSGDLPAGISWLPGMLESGPLYSLATHTAFHALEVS